jgi:ubiquinone/menaquinone biosynthesis C-methylase UbiE
MATAELSCADAERLRAFERHGHDALAVSYHDFFTAVTTLAIDPLLRAVRLCPGMNVLDVATGPGQLASVAMTRGAQVIGVDISPGMIDLARRLHPGIEFREADVEHLPFSDRAFDAVVCSFALGHFPQPRASVAECVRVLKSGGYVAFAWWDDPARQRIQGLFRETIAEVGLVAPPDIPRGHDMLRFSNTAEFLQLLRGSGLAEIVVEEHTTTFTVSDSEALWRGGLGSFLLTGAAIRHQDQATQDAVRAVFERLASVYKTSNGLSLPVAFKIGAGRKPN